MNEKLVRQSLQKTIFTNLSSITNVLSVTFVGSFEEHKDLSGISDIDTIVICDHLTKDVFNCCIDSVRRINLSEHGLQEYILKINSSFGPLKFDEPNLVVIHLMVYDLQSHRQHVILSPFTCLDWERSESVVGMKLQRIFPVGRLQPRDFVEARRGIDDYLSDIRNSCVSYRNYEFHKSYVSEVKHLHPLDDRHQGEYAFHIVRNLLLNVMKLINGKNCLFSEMEIEGVIKELLAGRSLDHLEKFKLISELKHRRSLKYPEWVIDWTSDFVEEFQSAFFKHWKQAKTVYFARHAQTSLNDGTFLGKYRDPEVKGSHLPKPLELDIEAIHCSPTTRSLQTARALCPDTTINEDELLSEIDYGTAEGMTYQEFSEKHPEILNAWSQGEDPRFPGGGENTSCVLARVKTFMKTLSLNALSTTLVVSHNVVLRCLIGDSHAIPPQNWYRLIIPHSVLLEFKLLEGKYYPNIPRTLLGETFSNLQGA